MSPEWHGCKAPEHGSQEIHCPVCLEDCKKTKSIELSACKHRLCKDCARTIVLASVKNGNIPILCPVCLAEPDKCPKCVYFKETTFAPPSSGSWFGHLFGSNTSVPAANTIKGCTYGADYWCCSLDADVPRLLSKAERIDYSRRSLQAAVAKGGDLPPCPKTDCPGIAVRGNEDNRATCNACFYHWCVGCGAAWHNPESCPQYLQDMERQQHEDVAERHFTSYKAAQVVKRCSSCGHGLEKIGGCDHVTCAGCRKAWHYSKLPRAI